MFYKYLYKLQYDTFNKELITEFKKGGTLFCGIYIGFRFLSGEF